MRTARKHCWILAGLLPVVGGGLAADTATEAYRAMEIRPADVLAGTVLTARVIAGEEKQVVCLTTYFTGKREKDEAVNVRLGVFGRRGGKLVPIYTRDFGEENDGNVGHGDLQLADLDADGITDIIVSYDSYEDPLIERRSGEVIVNSGDGFRTAWSGLLEYDATKAARTVQPERRDRFERELDLAGTLRTRGETLHFNKTVIAVAGERLDPPKTVRETFPLRAPAGS